MLTKARHVTRLALAACAARGDDTNRADQQAVTDARSLRALRERAHGMFGAIEEGVIPDSGVEAARFELGRKLFFERRLAADGQIACATCRVTEHSGGDGLRRSVGVFGRVHAGNAPSVFNTGLQSATRWDLSQALQTMCAKLRPSTWQPR